MAIVDGIRKAARKFLGIESSLGAGGDSAWSGYYPWQVESTSAGVVVTTERAMQVATVLACIRVISESLASLPLITYRKLADGGKERATDYGLYDVLHDYPNAVQTSFEWREMMIAHLLLRGNAYCVKVPGERGYVDQLIPLCPDRVKIERLENGRLRYIYRDERGVPEPYLQDEILHLRGLSLDGVNGISLISYARESLGLAIATEDHGSSLFRNGAQPGIVFKTLPTLKQEAAKKFAEDWERRHGGQGKAFRSAILPTGIEPHEISVSNHDAQFLETRKYQRSEICGIFRVPPHMVGDLERATFSNIEQQSIDFVVNTLRPWCCRIEQACNRDLVISPEYFVEFQLNGLLRGDTVARKDFYNSMLDRGVYSINEVRALENMNPIGPDGDKRFVPLNMILLSEAGSDGEADSASDPNEPATPEQDVAEDQAEGDSETVATDAEDSAAMSIAADIFADLSAGMLRWEVDAINRLASKPDKFLPSVDEFYSQHAGRIEQKLGKTSELLGELGVAFSLPTLVAEHLSLHHGQILEAAGESTNATLKAAIEKVTADWKPIRVPKE